MATSLGQAQAGDCYQVPKVKLVTNRIPVKDVTAQRQSKTPSSWNECAIRSYWIDKDGQRVILRAGAGVKDKYMPTARHVVACCMIRGR